MEKHRVGIYCGSFNPVHNGHITIAKEVVNQGLVDKVLMVATEGYWDKQGLMPLQERILMLKFFENENLIIEEELNSMTNEQIMNLIFFILRLDFWSGSF